MVKWCKILITVPELKSTLHLCLEPKRLNQALITPEHRWPMLNDILPKLRNACNIAIIDAGSRYHDLNLNKNHYT